MSQEAGTADTGEGGGDRRPANNSQSTGHLIH